MGRCSAPPSRAARAARIGIELDPRWADVYDEVVADLAGGARRPRARTSPTSGTADPGGPRGFDPSGLELRVGDALAVLPGLADASVDFVATDPPYNIQLPLTMAGGALAETHANRRTDYAMISDAPADLANAPDYATYLDRMGDGVRGAGPGAAAGSLRGRHRARRLPGRPLPVRRVRPGGARERRGLRAEGRPHLASGRDATAAVWLSAGFVPNIAHQHILVLRREPEPGQARRRLSR